MWGRAPRRSARRANPRATRLARARHSGLDRLRRRRGIGSNVLLWPRTRTWSRLLSVRSLAALPLLLLLTPWAQPAIGPDRGMRSLARGEPERVRINDNRRSAGTLRHGVLTVQLEARPALWYPGRDRAPAAEGPRLAP